MYMALGCSVDGPLEKSVSPITRGSPVVSTITKLSEETDRKLTASAGYDSLVQFQTEDASPGSPPRCTSPCSASRPRISCTSWRPNVSAPENGSSNAAHLM